MSSDGSRLAVALLNGELLAVDTTTGTVAGPIFRAQTSVPTPAFGHIAVDRTGSRAYVPVYLTPMDPSVSKGVHVVDLAARKDLSVIQVAEVSQAVALSTAEERLHVATGFGAAQGGVATIDLASSTIVSSAVVVGTIQYLAPVPAGVTPPLDTCSYALDNSKY